MKLFDSLRPAFQKNQHFEGVLASVALNRLGLHVGRIVATDAALALRRARLVRHARTDAERVFVRDGVVAIPDFFDATTFERVRSETRRVVTEVAARVPRPTTSDERGFGSKRSFPGGFDRFDGNTLNRFHALTDDRTPATLEALRSRSLSELTGFATGFELDPRRFEIYETVSGDDASNPDIQRETHRDTIHSTVKVWIFLEDVSLEDGPFEYVVGSHAMNPRRLRWEHRRALAACEPDADRDGSFRASPDELRSLALPDPTPLAVRANTLVLADVRGFHRRGRARAGAERLALYASLRAEPFRPIP